MAWSQLSPGLRLQTLEPGTLSVLPLLYRALNERAPDDPLLPGLKGTYRSTWVKNNLLAERLAGTVAALDRARVSTLLVGSLSAAVRYYPELALRPTAALEFLIEASNLTPATRALARFGWETPQTPRLGRDGPIVFSDAQDQNLLLRVAPAEGLRLDLATLGEAAVEVEVGRCEVRAVAAGDDLLIACTSGARVRPVRSLDWLVDIAQIVSNAPAEVDWQRLLRLATGSGQTLRLRQTFAYLAATIDLRVPHGVSAALNRISIPLRERMAYASAGTSIRGGRRLSKALVKGRGRCG